MKKQRVTVAVSTAAVICLLAAGSRAGSQNFAFTAIDVPSALATHARGVDNAGTVVGFYLDQDKVSHGFLRSPEGVLTFPIDYTNDAVRVVGTVVNKIDPQGKTLAGWWRDGASRLHGLIIDRRTNTLVSFDFPAPGVLETIPNGINSTGRLTGAYTDGAGNSHGFVAYVRCLRQATCYQSIDFPGQPTELGGLNDKGEIVGEYSSAGGTISFRFIAGKFAAIHLAPALLVHARAINNSGQIVGSYSGASDSGQKLVVSSHGFLLSSSGHVTTIDFPGSDTRETGIGAINDSGTLVGHYASRDDVSHGFVAMPRN